MMEMVYSVLPSMVAASRMWNEANATKELNLKFYLILTNLNLIWILTNLNMWLVATVLEIAVTDHLKGFLFFSFIKKTKKQTTAVTHTYTLNKSSFKEFPQMMFLCLN